MCPDQPVGQRLRQRPPPRWNLVAAAAPFVGFLAGLGAGLSAPHFRWFHWGFRVWLGFVVVGWLAAGVALARGKRRWGVTAAGLVLNAALLLFLVWAIRQE